MTGPGRLRARLQRPPANAIAAAVDVGGLTRRYFYVAGPTRPSPPIVVLHGAGGTAAGMAGLSGLAARGPQAGYAVACPDGWNHVWNDDRVAPGLAARQVVDDVGFLRQMIDDLARSGVVDRGVLYLVGMSNGAFLAEYLARHRLLEVKGVALVAGGATARARAGFETPASPAAMVVFAGTGDPLVPYQGGPIGVAAWMARRGDPAPRGEAVAAQTTVLDWARANGAAASPVIERWSPEGDLSVERRWYQAAGRPPAVLYSINGGGHTWPGQPLYLPERLIGPVVHWLDATASLLDVFAIAQRG